MTPLALSNLARTHAELGQWDDAWGCIGQAITVIETTGETWYEAEVHQLVVKLRANAESRGGESASAFSSARSRWRVSSRQNHAAMSMARLWHYQGKREQARDLLAPVYGWFTEGFDTLDLREAKVLLDELSA